MFKLLSELIRKDLRQFTADRRALIISFAVPIAIASFMATLFGNSSGGSTPNKIPLLVVDQDNSAVTQGAIAKLKASSAVMIELSDLASAQERIRSGKSAIAIVYPSGFGAKASGALMGGVAPEIQTLLDPSHAIEAQAIRGVVLQSTMGAVTGGEARLPFNMTTVNETAAHSESWGTTAHAFAGMAIQGLLFWAIESAMVVLRERKLGIWNRLRAAPVPSETLIIGRLLSSAIRAMMIIVAVLGFGMLVFGIRVHGSWLGLAVLTACAALMAASFGLFVAALGKTEAQSRGLTVLAVLTMTMLGGAWFPSFMMPGWVQDISRLIPVRYAVDGLDAMTWRGNGFMDAATNAGYLLIFAAVFSFIAIRRFRFEAE